MTVGVGTAEFGNGTATVHVQLAAEELGIDPARIRLRSSDTDAAAYDTGAFGSTGSVVAGTGGRRTPPEELRAAARRRRRRPPLSRLSARPHDGTPRSVAFNVHGVRVAVDPATGEVRVLRSVQAADAGRVINPEQLRGQVEGGVAQALGSALQEELMVRDGEVVTRAFRHYRVPQIADVPPTEVLFADTTTSSARAAPSR